MAKLIFVANVSLDGYIEDAHGRFEWTARTDEVFAFITDLVRPVGTYLYGRRMYETMAVWEADPTLAGAFTPIDPRLAHPVPQRALTDTETLGDIDDLVAIVEHHRHGITLELVGERTPRPRRPLLHH